MQQVAMYLEFKNETSLQDFYHACYLATVDAEIYPESYLIIATFKNGLADALLAIGNLLQKHELEEAVTKLEYFRFRI